MPITLVTGLPGHGKTLYSVASLAERAKAENRELYVHGIPDLQIPHQVLEDPTKWFDLPDGALIAIDEAQNVFPRRPNGSKVPDHVSKLNTHRHKGFDIHCITQHPSLIDNNLKQLVDEHLHVKRHFGTHKAFIYRWTECRDPKSRADLKAALSNLWTYPKDVFKLYRSATVHTVKRKIPLKIILGVIGVPFAILFAFAVIQAFRNGMVGPSKNVQPQVEASAPGSVPSNLLPANTQTLQPSQSKEYKPSDWSPRIEGLPHTAKAYDQITADPSDVPLPQACVNMHNVCRCFTDQGTAILGMPKDMCLNIVNNGYFNPYKTKLTPPDNQHLPTPTSPPINQEQTG